MGGINLDGAERKKHDYTVYNNDSHIVAYDGNVYFMNHYEINHKTHYELSSMPIDFAKTDANMIVSPTGLVQFRTVKPGEYLKIDAGIIFYQYAGDTYYYEIENGASDRFCQGNIQYLDMASNRYITLYKGCLYEGRFSLGTLNTYRINQLTTSSMQKLAEDKDNIYYYAAEKKPVLVGLRKNDLTFLIYDIIDKGEYHLSKIKLTDNDIIELVESGENYYSLPINKKSKAKGSFTLLNEEEIASFEKNPILNYSVVVSNEKVILHEEGKELSSIAHESEGAIEASLNYVEKIKNDLFYDVTVKWKTEGNTQVNSKRILAKVDLATGISYQINVGAQLKTIS